MKTRIVLLGPPASGKGTQAELIKARYGIPSISPGAMLRREMQMGTPLGIEADRFTRGGGMVPDEIVLQIVGKWLAEYSASFVFDGFPRTVTQADALEKMLATLGSSLDAVLLFDVSAETIFQRVMSRLMCSQCGRSYAVGVNLNPGQERCPACGGVLNHRGDDTPEALQKRMTEYREKTEPLAEYYRVRELLRSLQSADRPEAVFAKVASILEEEAA